MEKVILNPSYLLRQDKMRVILVHQEYINDKGEEWFTFLHPLQAQMLSFFKGEESFEEELKQCAFFFHLSCETMSFLVRPFVNNEQWFCLPQKNGQNSYFPKNVLITKTADTIRHTVYTPEDFPYQGEPDFSDYRLEYPAVVNMELTMKCYVDCCYCYANRNLQDTKLLSQSEILTFIQDAKDHGVLQIDINGGEVLLHPYIKDILKKLTDCNYYPLISTKMPIAREMIDYIKSLGISLIQISLDSAHPQTLAKMIKAKPSYLESISRTLADLSEAHLHTDINVVLTKHNSTLEEVTDLLSFLSRFTAVKAVKFNPCGFSLYKSDFSTYAPSIQQIEQVESYIDALKADYPNIKISKSSFDRQSDYIEENKEVNFEKRAICTGNLRNVVVLPNGNVTICEELYDLPPFVIGNIKEHSLGEIWNSQKALSLFNFAFKPFSESPCYTCAERQSCRTTVGICWKTVLMAYGKGSWDYPDPRCPKSPAPDHVFYLE